MYSVLIVDDESAIRKMLRIFLESQGYRVLEAEDGLAGIDIFEERQPSIVLTDVRMPRLNGLELINHIRSYDCETAIVVITGHGGEETAVEALRAGATNYLKKPIEIVELAQILQRQIEVLEARQSLIVERDSIVSEERRLAIDNDLNRVSAIISYLTNGAHLFFSRAEINYIKLGLDEMIRNAIEHGNFGITYEAKTAALENNEWETLLEQCLNDPVLSQRSVRIRLRQTPDAFECTIEDEGDGFDWRKLPDPKNPENLLASHGRGILLTSFYYDEVSYNEKGNAVTLIKHVGPKTDNAQSATADEELHTEAIHN